CVLVMLGAAALPRSYHAAARARRESGQSRRRFAVCQERRGGAAGAAPLSGGANSLAPGFRPGQGTQSLARAGLDSLLSVLVQCDQRLAALVLAHRARDLAGAAGGRA